MMPRPEEWEVRIEGRPDCEHQAECLTLTSDPPISQVRCTRCGRMLWQRHEPIKLPWPERPR